MKPLGSSVFPADAPGCSSLYVLCIFNVSWLRCLGARAKIPLQRQSSTLFGQLLMTEKMQRDRRPENWIHLFGFLTEEPRLSSSSPWSLHSSFLFYFPPHIFSQLPNSLPLSLLVAPSQGWFSIQRRGELVWEKVVRRGRRRRRESDISILWAGPALGWAEMTGLGVYYYPSSLRLLLPTSLPLQWGGRREVG